MRSEVIEADSIDAAAERILDELKEDDASSNNGSRSLSSRNNVVYFDGWDGLGASAVLGAVAARLAVLPPSEAPAGLRFDQLVHVDCSRWESRRALQRAVAEQLKLPAAAMAALDAQDEEDDDNGVARGSRAEIPRVVRAMYEHIQKLNHRFLVVFHNGSGEEIDLATFCGFPLSGYSTSKVLWTFQGRFRLFPRSKVDGATSLSGTTDVFLTASPRNRDPRDLWSYLVHQEAVQVAIGISAGSEAGGTPPLAETAVSASYISSYFLYMWKLCGMVHQLWMDYDMATHGGNYWMCDGIKQLVQEHDDDGGGGGRWRAAAAVRDGIQLDEDYYRLSLPSHLARCADAAVSTMPYWTSPTHGVLFSPIGDSIQQHYLSKLGVLKLARCTFSFSSPPFLCCHNLRFLWLDHCEDQAAGINDDASSGNRQDVQSCFQKLWVLDVRYTCCDWILSAQMLGFMTQLRELNVMGADGWWDIGQIHGRLPNIHKLRVTKSKIRCTSCSEAELFSGMNKMELLDFSGNNTIQGMETLSWMGTSSSRLGTVIIADGSTGIQIISFRGCARLNNVLLSGDFYDLRVLDLSGTAITTLDLSAMTADNLNELSLAGCDELRAILWPPHEKRKPYDLQKLHIDTTGSAASLVTTKEEEKGSGTATASAMKKASSHSLTVMHGARAPTEMDWNISIKDSRILGSLVPSFNSYFESHNVHVEIYSPSHHDIGGAKNDQEIKDRRQYDDIAVSIFEDHLLEAETYEDIAVSIFEDHLLEAETYEDSGNDALTITGTWPCPPARRLDTSDCYLYMQDQQMKLMDGSAIPIPSVIHDRATILHMHDSLSTSTIPNPTLWRRLDWCRVERCPMLEFIFSPPPRLGDGSTEVTVLNWVEMFWASQLPRARFLWDMSRMPTATKISEDSFHYLDWLHLDFCPRMIHVIPFSPSPRRYFQITTLEIVWCGDLRTVFHPLGNDDDTKSHHQKQQRKTKPLIGEGITWEFPYLERIHLHELPKLESICGRGRIHAPMLEKVKIRGCWSLRRLPTVTRYRRDSVECDCEKEWWDMLEWEGLHHRSMYKPVHSRHHKKAKMLRGTLLR